MRLNPLDRYGLCPVCKANWDGGPIIDTFLEEKRKGHWPNHTEEELRKMVNENYGEPRRWSDLIGIETDDYDGVSFWLCPDCDTEFPRFLEDEKKQ